MCAVWAAARAGMGGRARRSERAGGLASQRAGTRMLARARARKHERSRPVSCRCFVVALTDVPHATLLLCAANLSALQVIVTTLAQTLRKPPEGLRVK